MIKLKVNNDNWLIAIEVEQAVIGVPMVDGAVGDCLKEAMVEDNNIRPIGEGQLEGSVYARSWSKVHNTLEGQSTIKSTDPTMEVESHRRVRVVCNIDQDEGVYGCRYEQVFQNSKFEIGCGFGPNAHPNGEMDLRRGNGSGPMEKWVVKRHWLNHRVNRLWAIQTVKG